MRVTRHAIRAAALLAALAGAVAVAAVASGALDDAALSASARDEPVYLPKAEYLRPMSLGWQNVLADVLWFRTISYFGQHYRSDRTYPWLAQMCDLVTDLDPRADHVYRFAGVILPWEAQQADGAIRLLEKGLRQFPDSWTLHYHLGFHYYFFKNDFARALEHLRKATALPGAHPAVARLAAVLAAHQYGPETTLAFLSELQHDVDSQDIRAVVGEQLREAQLAAELQRIDDAAAVYRARTGGAPPTVAALVEAGLLPTRPADPFGGHFEIDPVTGAARSSTGRTPSQLHHSKIREKALAGESVRDM
jgi:tetratricopeptide (TPR) repeat protein